MLYKTSHFGLGIHSLKKNLPDTFFVIDKNSSYFEKECIFFLPLNGQLSPVSCNKLKNTPESLHRSPERTVKTQHW